MVRSTLRQVQVPGAPSGGPGGFLLSADPVILCQVISNDKMVRSILRQVQVPGAPSGGPGGFLLSGNLVTLCEVISRDHIKISYDSRHGLSLFSTLFPMVSTPLLADDGNIGKTNTLSKTSRNNDIL